jgi:hypothetical protein
MVKGLTDDQVRWKPGPEDWSILEVLNHLVKEECLDFRYFLSQILTPDSPWPKNNSKDWAVEITDNPQALEQLLISFEFEREKSVAWLSGLTDPNWDSTLQMKWGQITAGDLLASWLAHDILHLRQLVELRYDLTRSSSLPYQVAYAGEW